MRYKLLAALCAAVAISLLAALPAEGAIVNGDFEAGFAPWKAKNGAQPGCDVARRVSGQLDSRGGSWLARMGDACNGGAQGCDHTAIYQSFDCGDAPNPESCVVIFDSFLWRPPGNTELAFVHLRSPGGEIVAVIPDGGWYGGVLRVAVPGCGSLSLVGFGLVNAGDATPLIQSILLIDNVSSACLPAVGLKDLQACTSPDCLAAGNLFDSTAGDPDLGGNTPETIGACCGVDCLETNDETCAAFAPSLKYRGDGTTCATACPSGIPAVTEWGMAALVLLVLAAGTVVLMRRRAAAPG